eukprot:CAMPEP_0183308046 /NCGR_PEP_ID=MMETSP0160_2-20130417/19711_1 /TAXON_ID=2839 ORGANISM="Odontella Sinensis, Strain Grunow 1884" /NCGR_SAMPLE_ID=MMETSP0160_2 /ASSEMBLY_ACC=CAM_ASM_000250 /LENGTH=226 /DNA_ID=CAMNT_0025471789 /DNA_START=296 /DNA_END=976 /DNA_ORIENTATION=+
MALTFTVKHNNYEYNWGGDEDEDDGNNYGAEIAVTSRAMGFAALWTAILAGIMAVYGTVILGYQSFSGQYYWCCTGNVHTTSPLSLGAFVGGLIMFANLTLVCSVLFGEFEIKDYQNQRNGGGQDQAQSVERSSTAFSVMCMFLTVIYALFAALVFTYSSELLDENHADARNEALSPSDPVIGQGYIRGDRFDVLNDHNRNSLFTRQDSDRGYLKPAQDSQSGSMG